MSGPRNLHRIAGALDRMRREAAAGPCRICVVGRGVAPEEAPPSVGWIEDWTGRPAGVCQAHAAAAPSNGYTVHTIAELENPSDA